VDITGGAYQPSGSNDLSNCMTASLAHASFVDESGDILKGDIDMSNHKIINIANPKNSQDVASKAYVDAQNAETKTLLVNDFVSRENNFKELQSFWKGIDLRNTKISNLSTPTLPTDGVNLEYVNKSEAKLMTRLTALETVAQLANANESHFRGYVDNHKWSGESITSGTININRLPAELTGLRPLPYQQYGFILNIGSSSTSQKTTTHSVKLPLHKNLTYKKINLQLTLIQETHHHNDELFASIKKYSFENVPTLNSFIMIVVDSHRSSKELGWGLHLKAHLLITIFETEMIEIENNP